MSQLEAENFYQEAESIEYNIPEKFRPVKSLVRNYQIKFL